MEDRIIQLLSISKECNESFLEYERNNFIDLVSVFDDAYRDFDRASSKSWIGYQAYVYYKDLNQPPPGDHFSKEWGLQKRLSNQTSQNWYEYSPSDIKNILLKSVGLSNNSSFQSIAIEVGKVFEKNKRELLIILAILLEETKSENIESYRDEIKNLASHISAQSLVIPLQPKGQFYSYDTLAMSQGVIVPPHIEMKCWFYSLKSYFTQISILSQKAEIVATYLRQKFRKSLPRVRA